MVNVRYQNLVQWSLSNKDRIVWQKRCRLVRGRIKGIHSTLLPSNSVIIRELSYGESIL